jgi:hypothetical protein
MPLNLRISEASERSQTDKALGIDFPALESGGATDSQNGSPKLLNLCWTYSVYFQQLIRISGPGLGECRQRFVLQDHVGRYAQPLGFLGTPLLQSCR